MRLAEGVEWATHCAVLLAALKEGESLPARRLAEYHGVPSAYLAKTLQLLAGAGVVASVPGRRGGYRLAKAPERVTLLDVVLAVEGPEPAFRCNEIRRRGPAVVAGRAYPPVCAIAAAMWRAEEAWRQELAGTTVADVASGLMSQAPRGARDKTARWLSGVMGRNE